MKLLPPFSSGGFLTAKKRGFTLPELLIALTIFLVMIAGILAANMFGLSMFQMNNTKLNITRWSRQTLEYMTDEIHSCNSFSILNVDTNGNFAGLLPGEMQQGNGLQIYATTNATNYIIYYVNPSDRTFRRMDQAGNKIILADSITNAVIFSAQDFYGNVLSTNGNLIHIILEFYQPQLFRQDANYYKLETVIKQRVSQ